MQAVVLIGLVPVPISYFAERYISKPIEAWGLAYCGVTAPVLTPRAVPRVEESEKSLVRSSTSIGTDQAVNTSNAKGKKTK